MYPNLNNDESALFFRKEKSLLLKEQFIFMSTFCISNVILICNRFVMLSWSRVCLIQLLLFPDFCTVAYGEMQGDMLFFLFIVLVLFFFLFFSLITLFVSSIVSFCHGGCALALGKGYIQWFDSKSSDLLEC